MTARRRRRTTRLAAALLLAAAAAATFTSPGVRHEHADTGHSHSHDHGRPHTHASVLGVGVVLEVDAETDATPSPWLSLIALGVRCPLPRAFKTPDLGNGPSASAVAGLLLVGRPRPAPAVPPPEAA